MARIDESKRRGGGSGLASRPDPKVLAAIGVVAAILIGAGVWWGSSSSGVELTRSSEGAEEPVDPEVDGVDEAEPAEGEADGGAPAEGEAAQPVPTVTKVHVDGAVLIPGVYELMNEDPRVADAVAAAGGLTEEADTSAVNLAAQLRDADKVHIPKLDENASAVQGVGELPAGSSTIGSAPSASEEGSGGAAGAPSGPININTASAEELTALPGIGEKTAEKIVADREAQGPFASPEDLMRVSGIGEKKFAQIQALICV